MYFFTLVQEEVFKCVFPKQTPKLVILASLDRDSSLEGKNVNSARGDAAADCAAGNLIISRNGKDASAKMQQIA